MNDSMNRLIQLANELSAAIKRAQIETEVTFVPAFDTNDTFEDLLTQHNTNPDNK